MIATMNLYEWESSGPDLSILDDLDALQRDPATAELIRSGRTMGCFYIESPSMRGLLQRMRCECYEDVVAASSIIRPGVAESGMMKLYVERFRKARSKLIWDRKKQTTDYTDSTDSRRQHACTKGSAFLTRASCPPKSVQSVKSVVPASQSKSQNPKSKIQNGRLATCPAIPELTQLLADTHGVMVYQEDVLKVVHELGGLTLGEADVLRRAMCGKGGGRAAFENLAGRFFAGCRARGMAEDAIAELWRQIESFAAYSFCKGHSAAFAVLSYQVAYLKAHHPAEFMAAVLSNGGGFYGAAAYIQECRRLGLRVLGPDVNESGIEYSGKTERQIPQISKTVVSQPADTPEVFQSAKSVQFVDSLPPSEIPNPKSPIGWVRAGFSAIKNFPLDLARRIVRVRRARPFGGLEDFLRRTRAGPEATESLIRVGAFDRFGIPREQLFLEMDLHFRKRERDNDMADLDVCVSEKKIASKIENPKSKIAARVADEIEWLGYGVTAHPLELLPEDVWRGTVTACDMHRHVGRRVTMIGWPIASKLVRTRGPAGRPGRFMKFLSLEDLTDTFEVTLFPQAYRRFAPLTVCVGPFRVRGIIENEQGALSLVADWLERFAG